MQAARCGVKSSWTPVQSQPNSQEAGLERSGRLGAALPSMTVEGFDVISDRHRGRSAVS